MESTNNLNLEESFVSTNDIADHHIGHAHKLPAHQGSSSKMMSSSSSFYASPSKLSFTHKISDEMDSKFAIGYTGKKFREEEKSGISPEKCPGLGYTGWYLGKSEGILGRVNKKTTSISTYEPNFEGLRSSQMEGSLLRNKPAFEYDSNRVLNYENCVKEAESRGQSTIRILSDVKQKLEFRFRNSADRRATVKITFSIYDTNQNGMCSEDDFFTSLNQLSIILTRAEFMAICAKFDEYSSGEISYMKFLDIVCPV